MFFVLKLLGVRRENVIERQMGRRTYRSRERGHRCSPMTVRHFPAAVCVCLAHTQQFRPPSSQHNLIVQPPLPPNADAAAAAVVEPIPIELSLYERTRNTHTHMHTNTHTRARIRYYDDNIIVHDRDSGTRDTLRSCFLRRTIAPRPFC